MDIFYLCKKKISVKPCYSRYCIILSVVILLILHGSDCDPTEKPRKPPELRDSVQVTIITSLILQWNRITIFWFIWTCKGIVICQQQQRSNQLKTDSSLSFPSFMICVCWMCFYRSLFSTPCSSAISFGSFASM
jgi:hypothetical protein